MVRRSNEIVVIMWRDIPAQVNLQIGRERQQTVMPERFQRAIDRAKRKANVRTAHEDVAQWRRVALALDGDPAAAVAAEVARIDAAYPASRLGALAFAGGWERDMEVGRR